MLQSPPGTLPLPLTVVDLLPITPLMVKNLKSIAFLQPRVEVFQIDAGGVREKVEEWSAQAQENLFKGIEAEIQTRSGITIYPYAWENLSGAKKTDLRNLLDDTHV